MVSVIIFYLISGIGCVISNYWGYKEVKVYNWNVYLLFYLDI